MGSIIVGASIMFVGVLFGVLIGAGIGSTMSSSKKTTE